MNDDQIKEITAHQSAGRIYQILVTRCSYCNLTVAMDYQTTNRHYRYRLTASENGRKFEGELNIDLIRFNDDFDSLSRKTLDWIENFNLELADVLTGKKTVTFAPVTLG